MHGHRAAWRHGAVALLAVVALGCADIVTLQLPSVEDLDAAPRTPLVPSLVFDADGQQLAELRREFRDPVSLTQVPAHLVHAVLTAEDRRFYEHGGVDARSLVRAALANAAAGEVEQGGSTITQQLVKQLYLPDAPRTPETKIHEALLARQLESEVPKATILEDYLNTIYFGDGAYGIGAAAWTYFRVEVADLDVAQSALLAAIIRAPEAFGPATQPDAARVRRDDVLFRMAQDGHIDTATRNRATATPIEVVGRPPAPETREPHLVALAVRTLLDDPTFGDTPEARADRLYGGGLRIHTTLQPEIQAAARAALSAHLPDPDDPEAAIAAVDPRTGHVVAAVGNRAYEELQFDLATQARRQPGSTFKTFVLAAAIADGWHPQDRIDGRQGIVRSGTREWEVSNYDRRSYPAVTLAGATRASVNAAYARLGLEVGIDRVATLARVMGVRSQVPGDEIQITIGGGRLGITPLDLAAGYATIGNLGIHVPTTVVSRIEDAAGRTVWLPDTGRVAALSPSAAFVTAEVLQDAVQNGTGRAARVEGWQVAGKTGTTSDHADAWFAGTTPVLSSAVWMGRVEGRIPLRNVQGVPLVTGGSIPAAMFSTFMTAALDGIPAVDFVLPSDHYLVIDLDPVTGLRAAPWCPGETQRVPLVLVPDEVCPEPPPPPPPPPPAPDPEPDDEEPEDTDPRGDEDDLDDPAPPPVDPDGGDDGDDGSDLDRDGDGDDGGGGEGEGDDPVDPPSRDAGSDPTGPPGEDDPDDGGVTTNGASTPDE